jgi:zinc protease
MRLRSLLFAAVGALALTAPAGFAQVRTLEPWPHTQSDLPPDPAFRFGVLPNGMKYAIARNATPKGEASVRLRIDAGSLSESEAQRGIAHFLEHMAFNGSTSVKEGEMVKILERAGLSFGADTNAYTGWTETVYQLDAPETDDKTIDTVLFLMRELAGELLLEPEAIDRERGVILSEERTRDTPGLRVYEQRLGFFLKDQLPAQRLPIGKTEVIKSAPRAAFADFYTRHYRPETATLVVVGDFDPAAMEAKVKAKFADWRPPAGAPTVPALGPIARRTAGETKLVIEPGAPLNIQIGWVAPPDLAPDTRAKRIADTPEAIGFAVLNRRLERLARAAKPPFISASGGRGNEHDAAEITTLTVTAEPDRWREAITAVEQEQRRLAQYGVLQAEVDREVAEYRAAYRAAVAAAATRRNSALAAGIVGTVDDDEVFTSPATELEIFEQAVKGLTAARVTAAMKPAFAGQGPLVFMAAPKPVEGGEQAVTAALAQSRQVAVAAPTAEVLKAWPYADWGPSGRVAEQRTVEDLGATFVRFENGVRLTVKPTKLRDDEVLAAVRVGDGRTGIPKDRPTVAWAAPFTMGEAGTVDLSNEEIDRILSGRVYGLNFSIDDEAYILSGRTRPEDFGVQLEVLTAYAAKPGFRPEAFERIRSYLPSQLEQLEATPSGVLQRDLPALLHAGDPRWAFPTREAAVAAQPAELKALLEGPLAQGPIEVVIVGDITLERAVAEVARTFGALPKRPDPAPPAPERLAVRFPAGAAAPVVRTHKGRPDQAVAYLAWPTRDFFADPQEARTLRLLESVMDLRLTEELRETQGATYSPFTGFTASQTFPGYGYLSTGVEMPPDKLAAFYADVRKIAASLRGTPVTADELDRARKPRIEAIQRARESNDYWLGQLSGAASDPRKLTAIREQITGLQRVTPADLQRVARQYLADDKAWTLSVTPAAKATTAAGS